MSRNRSGIPIIDEFEFESLPDSCSIGIIGAPKSGKSYLIRYIYWFFALKYPVAKVFSGSEKYNKFFSDFVDDVYIHEVFDPEAESIYLKRQRECSSDRKCKVPLAINTLDDCSDDRKRYNDPIFGEILKNTSQHGQHMVMLGLQSAMDFPKQHRKCISYVFIFNETNRVERKALFEQFGGVCGNMKTFDMLMDKICVDHRCMVIRIMSATNRMEENIFHFKVPAKRAKKKAGFKFGCPEYRRWAKKRKK